MIELNNICVTFNKGTALEHPALKGLSLKIKEGEFVTLIGGNGAGKSTLMKVLSGETSPDSGSILIDNQDVTKLIVSKRAGLVSHVFQDPMKGSCADLTIEENLALANRRGRSRGLKLAINKELREEFRDLIANLGIGLEDRLGDPMGSLSGGQRQAVSLLMATLQPSKILLLDEHTAALDPKMAKKVLELTVKIVGDQKLTAIMITHSMTQALEYGTRTILMKEGGIEKDMKGKTREAMQPEDLLTMFEM